MRVPFWAFYPGNSADCKTLILGSHVDTVKQGGKYDGMLGVIIPIVCIKMLHEQGIILPISVMVVAFGDEEGTRFQDSMIGSGALAAEFHPDSLQRVDDNGISMKQAMRKFGLDPDKISECALNPDELLGYVEVHIEQGPVLEDLDQPVGVVTAITGLERHVIEFVGKSGHAGTVPMANRKDALVAASKAVVAIDDYLQATDKLVGVIGEMTIGPGSVNVIPDTVKLSLEFRSPERKIRDAARTMFLEILDDISHQSGGQHLVNSNLQLGIDTLR